MKRKLLCTAVLASLLALGSSSYAVDGAPGSASASPVPEGSGAMRPPDRLVMSSGSILAFRGDQVSTLAANMPLMDGSVLTPGGTVQRPDGTRLQLLDGQAVSIDGIVGPPPRGSRTDTGATDTTPAVKPQ